MDADRQNFFGVLLLGAAVWTISPLIDPLAQMLLVRAADHFRDYLHAIDRCHGRVVSASSGKALAS
jgi:hypothetical protein